MAFICSIVLFNSCYVSFLRLSGFVHVVEKGGGVSDDEVLLERASVEGTLRTCEV